MASRRALRITLESQLSRCPNGHAVGDEWIVDGKTPGGMCLSAFHSIAPFLMTLRFDGDFPWEEERGRVTVCCPDPKVVNVFRIERIARDGGT